MQPCITIRKHSDNSWLGTSNSNLTAKNITLNTTYLKDLRMSAHNYLPLTHFLSLAPNHRHWQFFFMHQPFQLLLHRYSIHYNLKIIHFSKKNSNFLTKSKDFILYSKLLKKIEIFRRKKCIVFKISSYGPDKNFRTRRVVHNFVSEKHGR